MLGQRLMNPRKLLTRFRKLPIYSQDWRFPRGSRSKVMIQESLLECRDRKSVSQNWSQSKLSVSFGAAFASGILKKFLVPRLPSLAFICSWICQSPRWLKEAINGPAWIVGLLPRLPEKKEYSILHRSSEVMSKFHETTHLCKCWQSLKRKWRIFPLVKRSIDYQGESLIVSLLSIGFLCLITISTLLGGSSLLQSHTSL